MPYLRLYAMNAMTNNEARNIGVVSFFLPKPVNMIPAPLLHLGKQHCELIMIVTEEIRMVN